MGEGEVEVEVEVEVKSKRRAVPVGGRGQRGEDVLCVDLGRRREGVHVRVGGAGYTYEGRAKRGESLSTLPAHCLPPPWENLPRLARLPLFPPSSPEAQRRLD